MRPIVTSTPLTASILAMDSSTECLSLALSHQGQMWCVDDRGGARTSSVLIGAIGQMFAQAGIGVARLDAIAFGAGPGAFTGLRAACAVAQGMAFGANKPLIPVNTLHAVAFAHYQHTGLCRVLAMLDARMGEWYWQCFDFAATPPSQGEPLVQPRDEIVLLPGYTVVDGATPQASAMLALAQCYLDRARPSPIDPSHPPQPLYVRRKVALTTQERTAQASTHSH